MSPTALADLFKEAQHTAVHLELRDLYAVDHESAAYKAWRREGHRGEEGMDPDGPYWGTWTRTVREAVARGVAVRRARVVSEPVSDYIRYEHSGTAVNLAAGEEVRWLPRAQASDLLLPGNDFWLFDSTTVRLGLFSGDGALVGHEVSTDPGLAQLCDEAFQRVWERAVPHEEYKIQ
ncbi:MULTISPECIES: DUF6879 family protein [Streptacidiphilus]|uniref:DUF6879 family protein n=1 Tax=Streptacidiphilus cavernicola TaxID=3342716 RepID=A0ABV6UYN0_9ACTN|nr:DUF6879 family protein [Streptacidiphilus jeojiense]